MQNYRIGGHEVSSEFSQLEKLLAEVHSNKTRPLCLCRPKGVAMYIAHTGTRFIIKRMPNSGILHSPACESFEPPPELSGLGQVMGSAIVENPSSGQLVVKLGFSMAKMPGRKPIEPGEGSTGGGGVKTDGTKLTMRGELHLLWEQAGFHRWFPAMAGKRNWKVIRSYLLNAAQNQFIQGQALSERLYIPEVFDKDFKKEIAHRRDVLLAPLAVSEGVKGKRNLKLLIGEIKTIEPARYGHKIVIKHLPDYPFMMNDDLFARLHKKFDVELGLSDSFEKAHLIMIGTFGIEQGGVPKIEEMALMVVSENWIPFEHANEKTILDKLTADSRSFVKSLRFNLPRQSALASFVMADTLPKAVALFLIPPEADETTRQAFDSIIEKSELPSWVWDVATTQPPALPMSKTQAKHES